VGERGQGTASAQRMGCAGGVQGGVAFKEHGDVRSKFYRPECMNFMAMGKSFEQNRSPAPGPAGADDSA
jgi:hypothetical protein